jgi:hypothetical protein
VSGSTRFQRRNFVARAREFPVLFAERSAKRRMSALERRLDALAPELGVPKPRTQADLNVTMRTGWHLISSLRASLLSLEERATRVVPAEVAALIGLWTQLDAFDRGLARALAWTAWGMLLVAILTLARLIMPSRLAGFWDSLVPPEVVLAHPKPLRLEEEAAIAARLSAELHVQTDRLRRGFRLTVGFSGCALVLTALAYVIEKS